MFKRLLVSALLFAPCLAWADGSLYADKVLDQWGVPVQATVRVCTSATVGTDGLCSSLATIYSNAGLSITKTNPMTAGADGSFSFYQIGTYYVQASGTGISTTVPHEVLLPEVGTGAVTAKTLNGVRFADQFATIQAAITDAGTDGAVIIPPTYAGTDSYSNANNILILDFRAGRLGGSGQDASFILRTSRPTKDGSSNVMPLGGDVMVEASGAGDLHLRTGNNGTGASTTATTSITGGGGAQAVTVGSTANFYALGGLVIDQYKSSEEQLNVPNYSITDGTHISITPSKSHTQPYNVTQPGAVRIDSWQTCTYDTDNTSPVFCTRHWGTSTSNREFDLHHGSSGNVYFRSGIAGDHIPRWYGKSATGAVIYASNGTTGTGGYIRFAGNDVDDSGGTNSYVYINPTAGAVYSAVYFDSSAANPSTTGAIRFPVTSKIAWRNVGNSANHTIGINGSDNVELSTGLTVTTGGSANHAICWKADGKTLGYCSVVVDSSGVCGTCN